MEPEPRTERATRNEHMFRQVNERLHVLSGIGDALPTRARFICECFQAGCSMVVELTADEYRAVRSDGTRFLVGPDGGHVDLSLEDVLERHERYWVVEKRGPAARVAEDLADDAAPL